MTTDPDRTEKIAKLREVLRDLKGHENELIVMITSNRRHQSNALRALVELGATEESQ